MKGKENNNDREIMTRGEDGIYRWTIARSMFRHPDSLPTVLKAVGATMVVMWVIMAFLALCMGDWEFLWGATKMILLIITPLFLVLSVLGYCLVAAMHGGKYRVVFEMGESMIVHRQINRSAKESDVVGWMSVIAGTAMLMGHASGGAAIAVNGIRANSKMVMKVQYKDVDGIEVMPHRNTIRLHVRKWKYDIWVQPEQLAFVSDFLVSHCRRVNADGQ